jgi:hypothetical protein
MSRRLAPPALVLAAVLADHRGAHGLAFDALLVAVPVTAVAGLAWVSDRLEGRAAPVQAWICALVLGLLLLATAARAQALGDSSVPPLARSALFACVVVFCLQAFAALALELRSLQGQRARGVPGDVDQRLDGEKRGDGDAEGGEDRRLQEALAGR